MNRIDMKKISFVICGLTGFAMFLLLLYLGVVDNIEVYQERKNVESRQIEDYSCWEIKDVKTPLGVKKRYSWMVEDTPKGDTCLAFYVVHQYAEVSIDGKVVYSLMPAKQNQITKTTGSNWIMIPLYPEDAGKEICVEITPVYENCKDRAVDFYIGSQHQIYLKRLKSDLSQLILGGMAVFAGTVFAVVSIYNYYRKNRQGAGLFALGCFSVMMGLWRLTDTRTTPFLLPDKPVFLFYTSIAMLMLGMIPLIRSMQKRFSEKVRRLFDVCCLMMAAVCLIQIILQISQKADFRENLLVTHGMLLMGCVVMIGSILYEKIKCKKKENEHIGRKFSIICVTGVVADTIAYYVKGNSSGLIFTLSAFLCYIIFTGIAMLFDYMEQDKKLKEQEAALASNRIAILLSQIQPHFLFNSLTVIKSLCKKDGDEAEEALDHFAGYLRGSMDSLKEGKRILFENELNHVKNYLYLEQKRFGDKLQIVYNIQERDFFLPSLSVQPMVENAVRHGVRQKLEGGSVVISSYRDTDYYVVQIEDDGVGFDVKKLDNMDESHVGITNVRSRLEMMCHGKLEISSTPGEGTQVLIKIPKNDISAENV